MEKNPWLKKNTQNFSKNELINKIKNNKKTIIVGVIALFVIFFLIVLLILQTNNTQQVSLKLVEKENNFLSAKNILEEKLSTLEKEKSTLEMELMIASRNASSLDKQKNELMEKYDELKKEVDETIKKIDEYSKEMVDSLEWFSINSILDNSSQQKRMGNYLVSNCLKKNYDSCEIKTACLRLISSKEFGAFSFTYKLDETTSNKNDALQSITDFFENKGGDCEDYSLLFKAQINHLINYCGEKKIIIEAYLPIEKKRDYYVNYSDTWFISYAKEKKLSSENIYPVVVCGNLFDLRSNQINGHCVVAFSSKKIIDKNSIDYLIGAEMVEPQSGEYFGQIKKLLQIDENLMDAEETSLGEINEKYGKVFLLNQNDFDNITKNNSSYIYMIITDNDLYNFSFKTKEWNHFALFNNQLLSQKKLLQEIN